MVVIISLLDYDFSELIKNGIFGGIIGQYISDLFFNIFIWDKKNFYEIITNISSTPSYIAATASGFANGITDPYIDDLTSAGMRNIVYSYTHNFFSIKTGEIDVVDSITMPNLVGDTMAVVILVWAFNIHAREDFYNHKADIYHLPHPYDNQMDIFTSIIIIFAINLYAYYKVSSTLNNQVDVSIDIGD